MVPPSEASPISVKLLALSVDIILGRNFREVSAEQPTGQGTPQGSSRGSHDTR